jgi:uncharacterized membrane protein
MKHPRDIWANVRASFWFVPAACVLAAVALAVILVDAHQLFAPHQWAEWPRLFGAGAAGARGLLTAVAGSMITVAGVVFSITIVALSLASSQYTSRILRNFMGDRANQLVLGVFVGVFAYCLVVLRTIRGGDEGAFVPGLAVLVAVLLAFVGIGFLIFFIHHIALSIQASHIVAAVAHETIAAVDRLFPDAVGEPADDASAAGRAAAEPLRTAIPADRTGYVQRVDLDALIAFARELETSVLMALGVGDFFIEWS